MRDEAGFDLVFEVPSVSAVEFSRLLKGFLAVVRFAAEGLGAGGVTDLVVVLVRVVLASAGMVEAVLLRAEALVAMSVVQSYTLLVLIREYVEKGIESEYYLVWVCFCLINLLMD